ncbi:MAG: hemin uptake protein HemP [Pirellulales bacterium]
MKQQSDNPNDEQHVAAEGQRPAEGPVILRSEDLLQGRSDVWIKHGAEMYRLRLTPAGKLYLTK